MLLTIFIILILILLRSIFTNLKGTQNRVKPISFILLPVCVLIYFYEIFNNSYNLSKILYLIIILAIILGGFVGHARSKSYSFTVNADGDLFYRKEIVDSVILITLLVVEYALRLGFYPYTSDLFTFIITTLIAFTTSSIACRRFFMFLKYRDIKKRL